MSAPMDLPMEKEKKYRALVTGFGPFGDHEVNASWQAVKELSKLVANSKETSEIEVIAKEIPVSYEHVSTHIPKLWEEYKPTIAVHVGVSGIARCLTIERCARSDGYVRPDVCDRCPDSDESGMASETLQTEMNLERICDAINAISGETKCNACISRDAGRYLCEYIFYKSLEIAPKRTLFVHVPDFDRYSSAQTATGLYHILYRVIEDIKRETE